MVSAFSTLSAFALLALSPGPTETQSVSLNLANFLAQAALASCNATNRDAAVAIVDRGGNLIALQRADRVGPHNTRAAERKAYTALSTKTSTSALAERAARDPASRNLTNVPELLLLGGGLPIVHDGEVIGGIGVAGSGGAESDQQCASAALKNSPVRP
ncbi:heme-binding protein [Novosphingobium sp. 17-62-19]|uniref:GlcG/HbpS family heme-binding protein n=1 Tax=Novosphingobium sp. 17-62-19 TaxID=1970406 RepID=UPI0025EFFCCB|nr:heme-binding protein [Novosphingobium sp. 17-62-19]